MAHRFLRPTGRPAQSAGADSTHYSVLGVPRDASLPEIRLAFRELTELFRLSEDSVEAAARFRAIREAFLVLADSERRAAYDERLREGGRRAQEI